MIPGTTVGMSRSVVVPSPICPSGSSPSNGGATHDFFTVLGLLVATAVVLIESQHRGIADRAMATIAVGGLLGAAIGARLGNWSVYLTGGGELTLPGCWWTADRASSGPDRGLRGILVTKRLIGYDG